MSDVQINELLAQMRAMAAQAGISTTATPQQAPSADFAAMLKRSINTVSATQQDAKDLAEAFELGDPNVELSRVMIEMQKARVSFEALTQVRNKLVSAYKEIMNMQV